MGFLFCGTHCYSAFLVWDTTQSALQCIITPVTGFNINPALIVHLLNSWGAFWLGATSGVHTCHIMQHITFASYRVPIYTPGWRAAMWIKCLAKWQKVPGIDGNRTRNPLIQSQWQSVRGTPNILIFGLFLDNLSISEQTIDRALTIHTEL